MLCICKHSSPLLEWAHKEILGVHYYYLLNLIKNKNDSILYWFLSKFAKMLSLYWFTIAIPSYSPPADEKLKLMKVMGLAEVCTIKPIVWIVLKTLTLWSTAGGQYFLIYYDGGDCCIEFSR